MCSASHSALLGISIYYHIERTIHSMYNPNIIHRLCQYICVFYAKNFFCMNRQYLFRGFWSREAFFDKTTEMFADLRSGCGRAASLAPTAGTQCLSRLRRPLRKQTAKGLFSAPYGKALQKQEKPPKDRKPSFRISCEKEKH